MKMPPGRCIRLLRFTLLSFASLLYLAGCTNSGLNLFQSNKESAALENQNSLKSPVSPQSTEAMTLNSISAPPSSASNGREVITTPTLTDVLAPGDLPEMFLGQGNAPVTIVLYASLSCPYCRVFMRDVFPQLKKDYIDRGKVRLVIREFPIGKSSGNATIALRCAPTHQYFVLFSKYLEQQSLWVSQDVHLDEIFAVVQQVGMKREKFDACLQNQSLIDSLKMVKDRGRKLGIVGTPNFFIQNVLVKKTLTFEEIRAMVDPLLGAVRAAKFKDNSDPH